MADSASPSPADNGTGIDWIESRLYKEVLPLSATMDTQAALETRAGFVNALQLSKSLPPKAIA